MSNATRTAALHEKPCDMHVVNGRAASAAVRALPARVLQEIGYAFPIYPSMANLVAAAATQSALRALKETSHSQVPTLPMFDFTEFCKLIGLEAVWAFENEWARPLPPSELKAQA